MKDPDRTRRFAELILLCAALLAAASCREAIQGAGGAPLPDLVSVRETSPPAAGPLEVLERNPRYFAAPGTGRAVYLTGSHTWNSFQDWGVSDPPPALDYGRYLRFLSDHGHNFIRLYVWEQAAWFPGEPEKVVIAPLPYLRTGPGRAMDGGLKFDLTKFDPAYFERLRARVQAAQAQRIYVSVMLFNGWSVELKRQKTGNPWRGHPFNAENNVNGVNGDLNGDGEGTEVHTLRDSSVTALQKAYVREVVETVGDLGNVLYEISNESGPGAAEWEYEMIRTVKALEAARGERHPVGMTSTWPAPENGNALLMESDADWISPFDFPQGRYRANPPEGTGQKIVIVDTDHIWGVGGNPRWVWKSFMRGLNPIFMDPYLTVIGHNLPSWPQGGVSGDSSGAAPAPEWEPVRRAMGRARALAERMDLGAMEPAGELTSTGYCLASPGSEYLVYLPSRAMRARRIVSGVLRSAAVERFSVNLSGAPGTFDAEWIDPATGKQWRAKDVRGGRRLVAHAPFTGDALLHLRRRAEGPSLAGIDSRGE